MLLVRRLADGTRETPARVRLDRDACSAAFERHIAEVRRRVPPTRRLEWRASDSWEPFYAALSVPVPADPFPRGNTTEEFQARLAQPVPGIE